jgi:hypothetical protein
LLKNKDIKRTLKNCRNCIWVEKICGIGKYEGKSYCYGQFEKEENWRILIAWNGYLCFQVG